MANMFFNAIKQDIEMIQGDTLSFGFMLTGLKGELPSYIYFTCKETLESTDPLFQVSHTNTIDLRRYDEETDTLYYSVRIPPSYTRYVNLGRYFYDLEIEVNGDTFTLMIGRLEICYEVTTEHVPLPPIYENADNTKFPIADLSPETIYNFTASPISQIANTMRTIDYPFSSETFTTSEMVTKIADIKNKVDLLKSKIEQVADAPEVLNLSYATSYVNLFGQSFNAIRNAIYQKSGIYEDNYYNLADAVNSMIWEGTQQEYEALQSINPNTLYIIVEE